jgi:hypothetical protein
MPRSAGSRIHPLKCHRDSFRTVLKGKTKLIVCCPKKNWKSGRCTVAMKVERIFKRRK